MAALDDEHDRWVGLMSFDELQRRLLDLGVQDVLVKFLPLKQDNDKNQIYLGTDLASSSMLPIGELRASTSTSKKVGAVGKSLYQADVKFSWLTERGPAEAPNAKLVYHPGYPEVRLSGLMKGCSHPPRTLYTKRLRSQTPGRVLVLGVAGDRVYGSLLPPEAPAARQLGGMNLASQGVMRLWSLTGDQPISRDGLLAELHGVSLRGAVPGCRIVKGGAAVLYKAQNAGGATLEAHLGIPSNPIDQPDFYGWELKSHGVKNLVTGVGGSPLTLLTSEPTGGAWRTSGFESFMRTYGHRNPDKPNRLNFAGTQKVGGPFNARNGTRLVMHGYDGDAKSHDANGFVALESTKGDLAATWSFTDLLEHWRKKHTKAVYVPSLKDPSANTFAFGTQVKLCEGASFLRFMSALADGRIYYDPGSWLLHDDANAMIDSKRRNQWRVKFADVDAIYDRVDKLDAATVPGDNSRSQRDIARLGTILPM